MVGKEYKKPEYYQWKDPGGEEYGTADQSVQVC